MDSDQDQKADKRHHRDDSRRVVEMHLPSSPEHWQVSSTLCPVCTLKGPLACWPSWSSPGISPRCFEGAAVHFFDPCLGGWYCLPFQRHTLPSQIRFFTPLVDLVSTSNWKELGALTSV